MGREATTPTTVRANIFHHLQETKVSEYGPQQDDPIHGRHGRRHGIIGKERHAARQGQDAAADEILGHVGHFGRNRGRVGFVDDPRSTMQTISVDIQRVVTEMELRLGQRVGHFTQSASERTLGHADRVRFVLVVVVRTTSIRLGVALGTALLWNGSIRWLGHAGYCVCVYSDEFLLEEPMLCFACCDDELSLSFIFCILIVSGSAREPVCEG